MRQHLIISCCVIVMAQPFTHLAASYETSILLGIVETISSPGNLAEYIDPDNYNCTLYDELSNYNYEELAQPLFAASPPPPSTSQEKPVDEPQAGNVMPAENVPPPKKRRLKKPAHPKGKEPVHTQEISGPMTRAKSSKQKSVTFQLPSRPKSPTIHELSKSMPNGRQETVPTKAITPSNSSVFLDDNIRLETRGGATFLNVYNQVYWKVVPGAHPYEIDLEAWRQASMMPMHNRVPKPPLKRHYPPELPAFDETDDNNNDRLSHLNTPPSSSRLKARKKAKKAPSNEKAYRTLYKGVLISKMATIDLRTGSSLAVLTDERKNNLVNPVTMPDGEGSYHYLSPQEFLAMVEQMTFGTLKIYIGDILCACRAYLLETEDPRDRELLEELSDVIYEYFVHLSTPEARKLQKYIKHYIWAHNPEIISEKLEAL